MSGFGAGGICGLDSSSVANTAHLLKCLLPLRWVVMLPTDMSISQGSQRYAWLLAIVDSAFIFGIGVAVEAKNGMVMLRLA